MTRRPIIKVDADPIGGWGDVPALDGDLATSVPNPAAPESPTPTTAQQDNTAAATGIVQQTLLPPPPPPNACVIENSFTPAFYTWLLKLQQRVGGFSATPSDDLQVLADDNSQIPRIAALVQQDPFDALVQNRKAEDYIEGLWAGASPLPIIFAGSKPGLVPTSLGGSVNFLRADGAWAAPSGGGGATITATTITAPYPASKIVRQTVTDGTVTATSKIVLSLGSILDTDPTSIDDLDLYGIYAIPGTGSFTVVASFATPFGGTLKINYMVA